MKTNLLLTFGLISGGLFAQQVASDSFAGTNGKKLPAHNASWLIDMGGLSTAFNIHNNAAGPNNGGKRELFAYWNATFNADQYSQGTVAAITNGCYVGVSVRASGSSAYYAEWSSSGVHLRKVVAGVVAPDLASSLTLLKIGDVMRLEVRGAVLTLRRNGVVELTATDFTLSSGAAGLGGGYGSNGCGTRVNAWSGGNLTLNVTTTTVPNAGVGVAAVTASQSYTMSTSTTVLSVLPSSAVILTSGRLQFAVSGGSGENYEWGVNGIRSGNSVVGTISSQGLYTAPAVSPNTSKITVTAVNSMNTKQTGQASVIVLPSVTVSLSPTSAIVPVSTSQQFTANITGTTNAAVTWSVNGIPGGNSMVGTVLASGLYTAPASIPNSGITVAAVSAANVVHPATAAAIVTASPLSIVTTSVLPNGPVGTPYSFSVSASGGTQPYKWSVLAGVLPTGLTVSGAGVISGTPSAIGSSTFTLRVTDSIGGNAARQFTVSVVAPVTSSGLDQYGGVLSLPCSNGSRKQFYTQKMGIRWYLCTPDGNAFFFRGVSHIDYNNVTTDGGYSYQSVIKSKFSSDPQGWQFGWADNTLARIKSWGFNSVGDSSTIYVWPWGSGGSRIPATKLPITQATAMSYYSFTNNNNYAPGATKSLMDALSGSVYTGWVGRGLPDVYDPNYDSYLNGRHAATLADPYWNQTFTSPWSIGFVIDESDDVFGLNGPGPEVPNPPDGAYHPHVGWIALAVSPTKTNSTRWGVTYSNPTVYSKQQIRQFLDGVAYPATGKYSSIAALNAAWGSNYTTFGSAGGWPKKTTKGTGLMDEDGSGPWLGDTSAMLYNATPGVVADLDAFLLQWARKYFSIHRTRFKQYSPNQLMFCPMLNNHGGLTRRQVLQAAGEFCDVIQAGADNQPLLDKTALYAGDHPIMHGFVGTPANSDSALWKYASPAGSPATTQPQRGTYYNTAANALWSATVTSSGIRPVVGFTFWEWSDNWNDNGSKINWGLVTARDNAYDGRESVATPNIKCQAPQQAYTACGGEDKSYGNFVDAVKNTNLGISQALADGK